MSKRISELESILCCQLFIRTKSGVEPTAAGNALLNLARRLVHDLEDIYVQMQDYASGVRGHVRVLTNISPLTQFLPTELASFRAAHPAVQIGLEERNSSVIAKAVAENAADVGVFTMFPHGQDIEVFPYHRDCLTLVCSPTHPLARRKSVAFAETLEFDYVGLRTGSTINLQLLNAAARQDRALRMSIQVPGYDALSLMVQAGLGIAVMPKSIAALDPRSLALAVVSLDEDWAERELKICVRSFNALPSAARLLVEHLRRSATPNRPASGLVPSPFAMAPSPTVPSLGERYR